MAGVQLVPKTHTQKADPFPIQAAKQGIGSPDGFPFPAVWCEMRNEFHTIKE